MRDRDRTLARPSLLRSDTRYVAINEVARQVQLRYLILNLVLDQPTQRTRSHLRIEALVRQVFTRRSGNTQPDAMLLSALRNFTHQ